MGSAMKTGSESPTATVGQPWPTRQRLKRGIHNRGLAILERES